MPRKAKPVTLEAIRAKEALKAYLARRDISVNAIAIEAGVGQPTVSRFLSGRTKSVTPAIRPLLRYAGIEAENGITRIGSVLHNPRVQEALEHVWDGRAETAEMLARLIEALGPVLKSTPSMATRNNH